MRRKKITTCFFNRPTLTVAKDLLGKYLIRKIGSQVISGRIVETEAYCGPHDKACHASKGRTKRTEVMFGRPGLIYVYMIYGMYYCLNIVTEKEDYPAAVLIRALELEKCDGPGKLCKTLKIDRKFYGEDICKNKELWIEDPAPKRSLVRGRQGWVWSKLPRSGIKSGKRIGVDYAGEYKNKPWRFTTASHEVDF